MHTEKTNYDMFSSTLCIHHLCLSAKLLYIYMRNPAPSVTTFSSVGLRPRWPDQKIYNARPSHTRRLHLQCSGSRPWIQRRLRCFTAGPCRGKTLFSKCIALLISLHNSAPFARDLSKLLGGLRRGTGLGFEGSMPQVSQIRQLPQK